MNVVYLVIFLIGNQGVTSQAIPQANLAQCQINAKQFARNYGTSTYCLPGVKEK